MSSTKRPARTHDTLVYRLSEVLTKLNQGKALDPQTSVNRKLAHLVKPTLASTLMPIRLEVDRCRCRYSANSELISLN